MFWLEIRKLNFHYALLTEVVDLISYYKLVLYKHITYARECTQLDTYIYIYNSMVKKKKKKKKNCWFMPLILTSAAYHLGSPMFAKFMLFRMLVSINLANIGDPRHW